MKKIVFIFILINIFLTSSAQIVLTPQDLDNLDKELEKASLYDKTKFARIDSIKKIYKATLPNDNKKIDVALKLGKEYESFISDSSYTYFEKALKLSENKKDSVGIISSKVGIAKVLGVSGLFQEAVGVLNDLEKSGVPESLKEEYYDAARQIYSYMIGYAESNPEYSNLYFNKNREYRDLLMGRLPSSDPSFKFYQSEVLQDQGKLGMSKDVLRNVLKEVPLNSALSARSNSALAGLSVLEDNPSGAAHFWSLSAISDIQSSIKENTSLQNLALYLYSIGDIDRAYKYISISMDDANFCNARLRNMQIAKNMPLINSSYKSKIEIQQKRLMIVLIVVSILSVGLVIAVILILYQIKKLKIARQSLKRANAIKEEYMGHFLELCSIYMERLDSFNKTVMRKVSTGQIDDLIKMTKSPKFAEEQNKLFYENFDSAFLHIYPTFVNDFNALLLPEERIDVKEVGKLTMELRIFAFLRLGIDDSNKIASFLHYSVNTIYTYRNKIRNKAINRTTFDKDIMKIGYPDEE